METTENVVQDLRQVKFNVLQDGHVKDAVLGLNSVLPYVDLPNVASAAATLRMHLRHREPVQSPGF